VAPDHTIGNSGILQAIIYHVIRQLAPQQPQGELTGELTKERGFKS